MPKETSAISESALKALEAKQETKERSSGGVQGFAKEVNQTIAAAHDKLKELPKSFQDALQNNIVQYFLTSADRYDANQERGLSRAEFERYKADMLKKLDEIIRQYTSNEAKHGAQEKKEGISRATEAAEKASRVEIKETDFREENLKNPEGIQTELKKFAFQSDGVRKESANLSNVIGEFHKALEKFEEGKKEWSVFLRGSPFVDDPETIAMKNRLMRLKDEVAVKLNTLQAKKRIIASYGEKLNGAGDILRRQKNDERDKKLQAIDAHGTQAERTQKKNETQYRALEAQQKKLYGQRNAMADYQDTLADELRGVSESRETALAKNDQLKTFNENLGNALSAIDTALSNDLPPPQREALEAKKKELLGHKGTVDTAMKQTGAAEGQLVSAEQILQGKRGETKETLITLNNHLANTVNPSLEALSGSIQTIKIAKLKNGTQREQVEAEYVEILQTIDTVDAAVANSVLENNLANEQALAGITEQQKSLNAIDIDSPNLWNATGGLVSGKIGEGWSLLTKDVICGMVLDPASAWVKKVTRNIPVVNVIAEVGANLLIDLPSGVIEGTGELINGITTMIAHPVDTLKGISTLIPLYNGVNGKVLDFAGAGKAWKEMGKAMIAYENFAKGEVGKGLGKVALNVLLTATGVGAATKGAQGASIAYSVARASGSGITRASMRAAGTGTRIFATEFSNGLAKIPGEAVSATGKILKTPVHLVERLKTGTAATKYSKEIGGIADELGKTSKQIEEITIGGKKIAEIPGLQDISTEKLAKLSGKELAEMGIQDARSIQEFIRYKTVLQKNTELQSAVRGVLQEVKKLDEQLKGSVSTFELRRECLRLNPKISTAEAYTLGDLPKDKVAMKKYLHDPANWIPERRAVHEAIMEASYREAVQMSERMGQHPPVLFLMRGNSGTGKTTVLRSGAHSRIHDLKILDARGNPHGSINTDTLKSALRKTEQVDGKHTITHPQAHPEGGILAEKQITRLFEEGRSIVVDKRLGPIDDIDELVVVAREKGYRVVMVDVDASLGTSMDRIHGSSEKGIVGRSLEGNDPIVPIPEIHKGFEQIRGARRAIESRVDEYYLFDNDVAGRPPQLVSQIVDGEQIILKPDLYEEISPLTQDYYIDSAMRNLKATSRTSAGVVDTSATTVKASSMAEGLSPAMAAKKANENFYRVIEKIFAQRSRPFASPAELRSFVEQVATDVNGGILKDGVLLRRADSAKFPYTKVADLPGATEEFYAEFFKRLNNPATDPVEFAAWVEWKIDLTHHFFEDGCGKTSKAISTFVLAKYGKKLPRYRGRGEYYAAAKPQSFDHWLAYYRTLFK